MAKPELGTKRLCGACGAKFYDLHKETIVCPKCGTVFVEAAPVLRGGRADKGLAKDTELEGADLENAEFVSLEEADAEAQGGKKIPVDVDVEDDDVDVEDDDDLDDAALIEEQEDGDADVTDIIGDGIEKEEES